MVTVIASITDKDGYVKRLSQETVIFEVEGEGELVGGREVEAIPVSVVSKTSFKPISKGPGCKTGYLLVS